MKKTLLKFGAIALVLAYFVGCTNSPNGGKEGEKPDTPNEYTIIPTTVAPVNVDAAWKEIVNVSPEKPLNIKDFTKVIIDYELGEDWNNASAIAIQIASDDPADRNNQSQIDFTLDTAKTSLEITPNWTKSWEKKDADLTNIVVVTVNTNSDNRGIITVKSIKFVK